jgi:hypothetical protein
LQKLQRRQRSEAQQTVPVLKQTDPVLKQHGKQSTESNLPIPLQKLLRRQRNANATHTHTTNRVTMVRSNQSATKKAKLISEHSRAEKAWLFL